MDPNNIVILAIVVTSLATYLSRFLGAVTSENVNVKSKIFQWFNCVAYSTLAALLGRMIIFPAGILNESDLFLRILFLIACCLKKLKNESSLLSTIVPPFWIFEIISPLALAMSEILLKFSRCASEMLVIIPMSGFTREESRKISLNLLIPTSKTPKV